MKAPPRPLILSHRGRTRKAPENTLAALRAAQELGCDGVEFDVRQLRDGTPVLHHDATLTLPSRGRAPLSDLGPADLRRLRRPLTTFKEVVTWASQHPRFMLDVEIKDAHAGPSLLELLDERRGLPTVVTTFDLDLAGRLQAQRPRWRVGWIRQDPDPRLVALAREHRIRLLVPHVRLAKEPLLRALTRARIETWVWGLRSVMTGRRLAREGVRALIVDVPRRYLALRTFPATRR